MILTMTIDHIGYFLFPQLLVFRVIGRIAFGLIAFLTSEGFSKTKNKKKYMYTILIYAFLLQIPNIVGLINMEKK